MFREFNVKFENVEMIDGADNLLENTKVTKIIMKGDNKMSSLDSTFKNCKELDTVDGELDLNGIGDIDNILQDTELVKRISLKNINNENISANNSFPHIEEITIGGELYNKKALQNVIASKEWTFDNISYVDVIGENVFTNSINLTDSTEVTINDTLEQKVRDIEIMGQTYNNLINGKEEINLIDELTIESVDGNKEFTPHIEQEVCVETIEGETYQNLVNGKGEYKLTDTFSTTWTESNNSIDNPPSVIEIPEIWGNTFQGYANVVTSKQVVDSIVNSGADSGTVLNSDGTFTLKSHSPANLTESTHFIQLKANTKYSVLAYDSNKNKIKNIRYYLGNNPSNFTSASQTNNIITTDSSGKVLFFPTSSQGKKLLLRVVEGEVDLSQYDYDEMDLSYIQSVGDLYVDENNEPILDEEGNEQYKLEIKSIGKNLWDGKTYHKGRKQIKEMWGSIDSSFTDNWSLKEPYGVQYDITASSMRGPTIPIEGLVGGKYINFTFKVTMPQYFPNITVHFFDKNKVYISNIYNGDNGLTGNIKSYGNYSDIDGVYLGGIIPKEATCCEIVFALSQDTDTNPYPQHIEITNLMVTVDDSVITSYRECEPQQSNKTTILMPQPLRRVSYTTWGKFYFLEDILRYDNRNGKYVLDRASEVIYLNSYLQDIGNAITSGVEGFRRYNLFIPVKGYSTEQVNELIKLQNTTNYRGIAILSGWGESINNVYWETKRCYSFGCGLNNGSLVYNLSFLLEDHLTREDLLEMLKDSYFIIGNYKDAFKNSENRAEVPYFETVETKILEKPISLETYSPKTYISTNTEVQPSQMSLTNKKAIFKPLGLSSNLEYTIQLDSIGKNDKPITVNLGGTETTIQPVNDTNKHHKFTVRTPDTLTNETLELSGEGVVANDVMLFQGGSNVIKQEVGYVDGIESIGELQEDGTYKIDILTKGDSRNICNEKNSDKTGRDFKYFNIEVKPNTQYTISYWDALRETGAITVKAYNFNNELIETKLMGYNWKATYTTPSNCAYIDVDIDSWWHDGILTNKPNVKFMVQEGNISSPIYEKMKSSTQSILLPQPLNKIGGIKDKFYWDDDKGHYCIEQNFKTKVINNVPYYNYNECIDVDNCIKFSLFNNIIEYESETVGYVRYEITSNHFVKGLNWTNIPNSIYLHNSPSYGQGKGLILIVSKDKLKEYSFDGLNELLSRQPLEIIYQSKLNPSIIDLPHLNKKYSLDTYMPTTYLQCANTSIQPSRLFLESDLTKYKPTALETNTDYTVQFECKEKSNKKIKLNLGGSEKEVDAIVGLNHVSITTPSEIDVNTYKDRLFLSGVGNKVDNVMVVEGEMNQYPEYFDGIQSVGELQEDGSYKIDIKTMSEPKEINMFDNSLYSMEDGTINVADGVNQTYVGESRVVQYIPCIPNYSHKVTVDNKDVNWICYYYNQNKQYLGCLFSTGNTTPYSITQENMKNIAFVRFRIAKAVNSYTSVQLIGTTFKEHKTSILTSETLTSNDKIYFDVETKKYKIDRNGEIEDATVTGDVIDLPRLYQREDTNLLVETGNIKPSKIKIEYLDID